MKLKLKKLHLINFKGIKDLEINFEDKTSIYGANATGKTTIFDAYSWLLWNKDSLNRKKFGIKPYDENNEIVHGVDSMVEGLLEVDGKVLKLTKVYSEEWGSVRGKKEKEFKGNTTDHYINDVPVKQKEYNEKIESFIGEKEFNLLSNPLYFNAIIDKKERRQILLSLIKDVDKSQIIALNKNLEKLDLENYKIEEIRAMAKSTSSKINKEIESLPARIDELEKSKNTYNFESIERNKNNLEKELEDIEKALSKGNESTEIITKKNAKIQEYLDRQRDLKRETDDLNDKKRREIEKAYNDKKEAFENKKKTIRNEIIEVEKKRDYLSENLIKLEKDLKGYEELVSKYRQDWIDTNSKIFDGSLNCPTCGRPYEEHKQKEIKETFNLNKSKELEKIQELATTAKEEIEDRKKLIESTKNNVKTLTDKVINLEEEFKNLGEFKEEKPTFIEELVPKEYTKLQEEIDKIKEELKKLDSEDNTELIQEQKRIKNDLESINKTLGLKGQNEALDERIEAYKKEEKKLAKAFEEKVEILDLCDEYTRTFTELVSTKINILFDLVNFKLFEKQVNGALVETCEVMVKGVPYSDLNNAAKINAGIDVINTLNKYLGKSVPIFVDNAESINKIMDTKSQLVKLVVSEDKELNIKGV